MSVEEKIVCRITHSKPIDLLITTKGFLSLCRMYDRQTESGDSKLSISEVRKGSIEIDIIAVAAVLLESVHPVILTIKRWRAIYEYILNSSKNIEPKDISQADYIDTMQYAKIANEEGTIVQIKAGTIVYNNTYHMYQDAKKNYASLKKNTTTPNFHSKELFVWKQINLEKLKIGNRGIISNIESVDKQVIFDDQDVKLQMTKGAGWEKKGYIVDVIVQRDAENKIRVYKIVALIDIVEY